MNNVPQEVRRLIVSKLDDPADLKSAGLVTKSLSAPATRQLFSKVNVPLFALLNVHESDADSVDDGNESDSAVVAKLGQIIPSEELRNEVRYIIISTSPDPEKTLYNYHNYEKSQKLHLK